MPSNYNNDEFPVKWNMTDYTFCKQLGSGLGTWSSKLLQDFQDFQGSSCLAVPS